MNEPYTARQRQSDADAQPRRRVLIVEDEASICEVLTQYLALEGFAVVAAADGMKVLRLAERAPPHLVMMCLSSCFPYLMPFLTRRAASAA